MDCNHVYGIIVCMYVCICRETAMWSPAWKACRDAKSWSPARCTTQMSCWSIQLRGRLGCLHTTHPLRIYTYIHTLYGITEISSVLCCCSEPTKISRKYLEDGTKVRVSKKTGTIIPKPDPLADRKPRSIGMLRSEALYVFMYVCMYVFIEHRRHWTPTTSTMSSMP